MFYCSLNHCHLHGSGHMYTCPRFRTAPEPLAPWEIELLNGMETLPERQEFPADTWESANLVVTFVDGEVITFDGIRFLARTDVGATDPIVVKGSTLIIEDAEQTFTLLNVRFFTFDFSS